MYIMPYRTYLPTIRAGAAPYYGLVIADPTQPQDVAALGASWVYDWRDVPITDYNNAEYVPMLWSGKPSDRVPGNYEGDLLIFNEPNVETQCNLSPSQALVRLNALRVAYPKARLICCGASVWAWEWMREFWELGGRPDAWHVHAYTEAWVTPAVVAKELTRMHNLTGGEYWITEYGSPTGCLDDFGKVTRWLKAQPWITRIAPYTNRQPAGQPWTIGAGVELVGEDGRLTEIGEYYARR